MKFSDVEVGKRLFVGCGEPKALKTGEDEVRGSALVRKLIVQQMIQLHWLFPNI